MLPGAQRLLTPPPTSTPHPWVTPTLTVIITDWICLFPNPTEMESYHVYSVRFGFFCLACLRDASTSGGEAVTRFSLRPRGRPLREQGTVAPATALVAIWRALPVWGCNGQGCWAHSRSVRPQAANCPGFSRTRAQRWNCWAAGHTFALHSLQQFLRGAALFPTPPAAGRTPSRRPTPGGNISVHFNKHSSHSVLALSFHFWVLPTASNPALSSHCSPGFLGDI